MKIIFATKNKGKYEELKKLFVKENLTNIDLISLNNIESPPKIIENGTSFEENAKIKAEKIFEIFNIPVIADDSGLIVEALKDEPGIYSARYAGENATDEENNEKLLKKLKSIKNRTAYFECALAFINKKGKLTIVKERCYGKIIDKPKGNKGFGYDPIFFIPEVGKTMAELEPDEKNKISHRGKAFKKLINLIKGDLV